MKKLLFIAFMLFISILFSRCKQEVPSGNMREMYADLEIRAIDSMNHIKKMDSIINVKK